MIVTDSSDKNLKRSIQYAGGTITTRLLDTSQTITFSYDGPQTVLYNGIAVTPGSVHVWERCGIVKCWTEKPLYYYNAMALYKDSNPDRVPLKLRGNNVDFTFSKGSGGIHDFTFNLYSGELVAIMGGSGTGKSTLLSILNGTIKPQSGGISINGHSLDEPGVKDLIGYVPQDDLLIEELTVYQNLMFTARLCFDKMPDSELEERVMSMLQSLGLEGSKDLKAGSPLNKYISGGQRKRLNIALELIREPEVLYLDEPTSGLSSADAVAVMNLLREQAYKGKLIIAIIHQPSSEVFKMFDRLWILDTGGYPVYDGNPIEAVTYFKQAAGYADAQVGICPTCGNVDSETIFSIIDEKVLSPDGTLTTQRKVSPEQWHSMYLGTAPKAKDKLEPLPQSQQRRPGKFKQMLIYLRRNAKAKFTDRQWWLIALLQAPALAVICALLTHYAPSEGYSVMDNKNLLIYMFMSVIVATFLGMSGSAGEIIKDRALLRREKFLSLSYGSYIWSKILFVAGVTLVQTFLFVLVGNLMIGLRCLLWQWWLILFASGMLAGLVGLLLSQWLRSIASIYITIPVLLIPQILLCGLVVNFNDLTPGSKTGNVPVIGDIIPSRWAYEALAVTAFTDNPYESPLFEYDKERFESSYYSDVYLKTLKDKLDGSQEGMSVIRTSLPLLLDYCQRQYDGDYSAASLQLLFDELGSELEDKTTKANVRYYRAVDSRVEALGSRNVMELKRQSFNLALEDKLAIGSLGWSLDGSAKSGFVINDGQIVPRTRFVFLDPMTNNGRAQFYSSVKVVGSWRIKTLWFNLVVMLLMGVICTGVLLCDLRQS